MSLQQHPSNHFHMLAIVVVVGAGSGEQCQCGFEKRAPTKD